MCKLSAKLVSIKAGRVLSVVIIIVSFSVKLMAQKPDSSERFRYLRKTIAEFNKTIYPSLKGLPFLTLLPKSLRIYSPEEGVIKVTITSNTKWILYCSEKWISSDTESGGGFNEVIFKVMENPESFERTARIVINSEGLPEKTVMLSQKARHDE